VSLLSSALISCGAAHVASRMRLRSAGPERSFNVLLKPCQLRCAVDAAMYVAAL
jgi:hypothetical protein